MIPIATDDSAEAIYLKDLALVTLESESQTAGLQLGFEKLLLKAGRDSINAPDTVKGIICNLDSGLDIAVSFLTSSEKLSQCGPSMRSTKATLVIIACLSTWSKAANPICMAGKQMML